MGRKIGVRSVKGSKTVTSIKSKKAIFAIRQYLADRPRDLALFVCGINWGLRGHDLCALQWKDLLTDAGDLKKTITVTESKNQNVRHLTVNAKVKAALLPLLKARQEGDDNSPFVFPSRKGNGALTNVRLHQLASEWTRAVNLDGNYGGHSLRKTFGYWAYNQGISLALLMSIFGHSSERMTLRYIGITSEQQREVYLKMSL